MTKPTITVVGGGLAGCEAAWQLASRGISVRLFDMKPHLRTPAHHSNDLAELVCSNSLRGGELSTAPGLLKEELRRLGSLLLRCADETRVPAGGALAVDREAFSAAVTLAIRSHPNIEYIPKRIDSLPDGPVVIATGPLTDMALYDHLQARFPLGSLHFFDASAPIVTADSIDMSRAFIASRYDKGTPDYINCPMDEGQYTAFVRELAAAEQAPVHAFEDAKIFEGCMPVEVMARRGIDSLRHGPLKPVGLRDEAGMRPYAVVQLRRDNAGGSLYNLVGFQTHLTFAEQRRVFCMIPALECATFERYGVMHRNAFIDAPRLLDGFFRLKTDPRIYIAGQFSGVEGYIESIASGLYAGLHAAHTLSDMPFSPLPRSTAIGALAAYISDDSVANFQPMNINFGIIDPLDRRIKSKRERYLAIAERSLATIDNIRCTVYNTK